MGNRGTITTPDRQWSLYVHWNGGRDSVEAFLKYCELKGFPDLSDKNHREGVGLSRLVQVISNFTNSNVYLSAYRGDKSEAETADDNGVYVVSGWKIVDRVYPPRRGLYFYEQETYDIADFVREIDECMPAHSRLPEDVLNGFVASHEEDLRLIEDPPMVERVLVPYSKQEFIARVNAEWDPSWSVDTLIGDDPSSFSYGTYFELRDFGQQPLGMKEFLEENRERIHDDIGFAEVRHEGELWGLACRDSLFLNTNDTVATRADFVRKYWLPLANLYDEWDQQRDSNQVMSAHHSSANVRGATL